MSGDNHLSTPDDFWIRATRPGKAETTQKRLTDLREDTSLIESENSDTTVSALEVVYSLDLGRKFSGNQAFIQALEVAVPHFYREAGQFIKAWTPPPPKIPTSEAREPKAEEA